MPVLSAGERQTIWAEIQRDISKLREPIAVVRADGLAAIAASDDWIQANEASFNSALPLPARTALTQKQKFHLFQRVLRRRFELL